MPLASGTWLRGMLACRSKLEGSKKPWGRPCLLRHLSRAKSQPTEALSIDNLIALIPSPGKRLAANDLMFSTDLEGNSKPNLLREYIQTHTDGPPRFTSPVLWRDDEAPPGLVESRENLPLMLYLPGLDGSGICAARQFPMLQQAFDLRKLVIPLKDRTPFPDLVHMVTEYLEAEVSTSLCPDRPVYVLGESFGGLLALATAAASGDIVDRVVLVNPATSFPRSIWPSFGPVLSQLPANLYRMAPFALVPFLGDPFRMASFYTPAAAAPTEQVELLAQGLVSMLPLLGMLSELLPSDTLEWKIEILTEGSKYTEPKYPQVRQPVLVIAGDADLLIPSDSEARMLSWKLPDCSYRVLPGHSHILMQERGVDIAAIIKEDGMYITES